MKWNDSACKRTENGLSIIEKKMQASKNMMLDLMRYLYEIKRGKA